MRNNYFICFCLIFFNFICGYSQIVNEGILQITSTTDVYFENEYINKTTGIHNNNGSLYLNNNFVNDGVTSSTSGTTYFKSSTNPLLSITGTTESVNFYNLEVDITATSTKGLLITDQFALNVENSLSLINGDLRLEGESQLIQSHSGMDTNTIASLGKF